MTSRSRGARARLLDRPRPGSASKAIGYVRPDQHPAPGWNGVSLPPPSSRVTPLPPLPGLPLPALQWLLHGLPSDAGPSMAGLPPVCRLPVILWRCSMPSASGRPTAGGRCTPIRTRPRWRWPPATTWCWRRRRGRARASSPSPACCSPASAAARCGPHRSRHWSPRSSSIWSICSAPTTSGWRRATRRSTSAHPCSCARPRCSPTTPS